MRFAFDATEEQTLKGESQTRDRLEEAQEIFEQPYYLDQRSDMPEQYRAIGWVDKSCTLSFFEIREDEDGEYYHLVTLGKQQPRNNFMRSTRKKEERYVRRTLPVWPTRKGCLALFHERGSNDEPNPACKCRLRVADADELDNAAKELTLAAKP